MDIFLPCRKGSIRIPSKNTRPFSKDGKSLLSIKLGQLLQVDEFRRVILSTDDDLAIQQAQEFNDSRLFVHNRPKALAQSSTKLSDLVKHAASLAESDYVAWTHVTSPFFSEIQYRQALSDFGHPKQAEDKSLASAFMHQNYFMQSDGRFLDSGVSHLNWPRTQDLAPVYEIDSALFIASRDSMLTEGRRTSENIGYFLTDRKTSIDIDWESDFKFAQFLWNAQNE